MKAQKKEMVREFFAHVSVFGVEREEIITQIDELRDDYEIVDIRVVDSVCDLAELGITVCDLIERYEMAKDGISEVARNLDADGWDAFDAARDLNDYVAELQDLNFELTDATATLVSLIRELMEATSGEDEEEDDGEDD